jgi:hypothetical protein
VQKQVHNLDDFAKKSKKSDILYWKARIIYSQLLGTIKISPDGRNYNRAAWPFLRDHQLLTGSFSLPPTVGLSNYANSWGLGRINPNCHMLRLPPQFSHLH